MAGSRRVLTAVAVCIVVLAAALTGAWYWAASELDRRVEIALEAAAGEGVGIGCTNREVFGYPFRIGLRCEAVTVDAPAGGVRATGGALRTAAQVYAPRRIVAELDSPVSVDAPDLPPLDLRWDLGQASAAFTGEGLERLSVAVDNPVVALRQPAAGRQELARSQRLEVHARRNAGDLDLAFTDDALVVTPAGLPALPTFDLSGNVTVAGAAEWMAQGLPGGRLSEALRGRSLTVHGLRIAPDGGGAAEISGPVSISPSGEISGDVRLAVDDPGAIAGLVGRLVPGAAGIAEAVAGGLGFAGRQENGQTVVDIEIRDGRAQLGFIPLGRIPPI